MEEDDLDSGFRLFNGDRKPSVTKGSCSSMDYGTTTSVGEDIPQKEMEGWQPFYTFKSVKQEEKKTEDTFMFGGGVKRKFEASEDEDTFVPEKGFYQPSSEDTWEAYQALMTLIESQSKANLPRAVLCGVADEVLSVLKSKNISNPMEKKIEIEKILYPIPDFVFNELVKIARRINDYYVVQPVRKSDDRAVLFVPEEGFYQPKSEDTCTAYKLLLDTIRENLGSDQPQIVQCVVAHEILVILEDVGIANNEKKEKMEKSFLNYVSDDTFDLLVFIADLIKDFDEFKVTTNAGYTFGADVYGNSSSGWTNFGADAKGSSSTGWGADAKSSSSSGWINFGADAKGSSSTGWDAATKCGWGADAKSSSSTGWSTDAKVGWGADAKCGRGADAKGGWGADAKWGWGADAKGSSSTGWGADVKGGWGSDVANNEFIQKPNWPRKVIEGFQFDAEPFGAIGTPPLMTYSDDEDDQMFQKDLLEEDNASIPMAGNVDVFDPMPDNVSVISDRVADISLDDVPDNVSIISDRVADISLDDLDKNPASGDVANAVSDNALSQIKLEYSSEEEIMYFDHYKVLENADKEDSDGWLKVDFDEDGI